MRKLLIGAALCAFAVQGYGLTLISSAFDSGGNIPAKYAYCKPDGKGKVKLSNDISPPLHWANVPKGTKSFVLLAYDPDIPASPYFDVSGKKIKKGVHRQKGYHWVLVNIPSTLRGLPEGAGSKGFNPKGKKPGQSKYGLGGINVYTGVFQSPLSERVSFKDNKIKGKYGVHRVFGHYDGPCAPWNDEKKHKYTFVLYALDVAKLRLNKNGLFQGQDVVKAIKGHVLAKSDPLVGYSVTNKALMKK